MASNICLAEVQPSPPSAISSSASRMDSRDSALELLTIFNERTAALPQRGRACSYLPARPTTTKAADLQYTWNSLPDDFSLDGYMQRYARAVVEDATMLRGIWLQREWNADASAATSAPGSASTSDGESASDVHPSGFTQLHLDLGCGKGDFAVGEALAHSDTLFVGLDVDAKAIACAAKLACESGAGNARFCVAGAENLEDIFAPGELDAIYLNFPTPCPKARDARRRLVHPNKLARYHRLLAPDGRLMLRTDNQPLFAYAICQLERCGFGIVEKSDDARRQRTPLDNPGEQDSSLEQEPQRDNLSEHDLCTGELHEHVSSLGQNSQLHGSLTQYSLSWCANSPVTGYERRALELGARIYAAAAVPKPCVSADAPAEHKADSPLQNSAQLAPADSSLYDYIDENLDPSGYLPPEMKAGIESILRERKQSLRKGRKPSR